MFMDLDQKKQAKMQWLQDPNQRNVDNLNNLHIKNQQDASSIQNFICHETLHVSCIFGAHHQELSAVHMAIGMFHAGYVAAA